MIKSRIRYRLSLITVLIFLAVLTFSAAGCRILKKDKQTQALKKQEKADKDAAAEYEKARKQYHDRQSKQAKKMMKQTKKKAAKFNKPLKRKSLKKKNCD